MKEAGATGGGKNEAKPLSAEQEAALLFWTDHISFENSNDCESRPIKTSSLEEEFGK